MQTDYAQILPVILPVPKAGPSAPANFASSDGKAASASGVEKAENVALDAAVSDDDSADQSQTLSAFDQALAQMMMVQVPAPSSKPVPQAPSQQGLAANPIDITSALEALQPGAGPELASGLDAGSVLKAPVIAASVPADRPSGQNPQAADGASDVPQTLPAFADLEVAPAINGATANDTRSAPTPRAADQASPTRAANFADLAPDVVGARAIDAMPPSPLAMPNVALAAPAPTVVEQLQPKPIDLALAPAQAAGPQTPPSAPQVAALDTASVAAPLQATTDRPLQASLLQAMGDAASDPTARIIATSLPQTIAAPNLAAPAAPEMAQAPTIQSNLVQAQSATLAPQTTNPVTTQVLAKAQAGTRETSQVNGRPTTAPIASGETSSTSPIASPLTAIAIATNGGANSADTGGAFQEAPSDFSEAVTLQAAQSDSEAATDIFGAPLPLEGRVTQASLQTGWSVSLSTPATAPHLAAEISRKFEGKSAQFDISLTPEGLGKVDVKITINARGEVSAAMKFDNPQAAAELKGRAAELQRALEQSGFSLSQEGISFSDGQGQGFNAPQQQASQQDWQETARRTAQNRLFQDSNDLADAAALRVAEASSAYSRRSNTGVDVRI
ncbi:MAG: hypothetical protein RIT46_1129 [Pseudomonadota bacterium]